MFQIEIKKIENASPATTRQKTENAKDKEDLEKMTKGLKIRMGIELLMVFGFLLLIVDIAITILKWKNDRFKS